jgi:hypothetical protein
LVAPAVICCEGAGALPSAYVGELRIESGQLAFAASHRVGGRFNGFLLAMAGGMVAGKGAARVLGRSFMRYAPSPANLGSLVIPCSDIAAADRWRGGWDLRLVANSYRIDRILVGGEAAKQLGWLPAQVVARPSSARGAPRWPRAFPSWIEVLAAPCGVVAASLADGLRDRLADPYQADDRRITLVLGAITLTCAASSAWFLRTTRGASRVLRAVVAVALFAMATFAIVQSTRALCDPPPKRLEWWERRSASAGASGSERPPSRSSDASSRVAGRL